MTELDPCWLLIGFVFGMTVGCFGITAYGVWKLKYRSGWGLDGYSPRPNNEQRPKPPPRAP